MGKIKHNFWIFLTKNINKNKYESKPFKSEQFKNSVQPVFPFQVLTQS